MTLQEKAASLSCEEIVELLERNAALEQQLEWFKRQIFGPKSERRLPLPDAQQLTLGQVVAGAPASAQAPAITVAAHSRRPAKPPWETTNDGRLKFDASVPVQDIEVPNPDTEIYPPEAYDVVGEKITCRLAQRPGAFVVLRFSRKVLKFKGTESFSCPPAPPAVFEKSVADVSFLAGLLVDKFRYHLPLYRQHQRLGDCGIWVSRATLTHLVHRTAALLEPIEAAQRRSILASAVLAMDETPIRAGRTPGPKAKMRNAYFWPLYGDRREVSFVFSPSRSLAAARDILQGFHGKLLSDGYTVYERYVETIGGVEHAQCWSHYLESGVIRSATRRTTISAVSQAPGPTTAPDKDVRLSESAGLLSGRETNQLPDACVYLSCAVDILHSPRGTTTRGVCWRSGGKAASAMARLSRTCSGFVDSAPTAESMVSSKACS